LPIPPNFASSKWISITNKAPYGIGIWISKVSSCDPLLHQNTPSFPSRFQPSFIIFVRWHLRFHLWYFFEFISKGCVYVSFLK
jgi:hypothetical protein